MSLLINFASMVFGDDIEKVNATAVLTEKGVDAVVTAALTYRDGRAASDAPCRDHSDYGAHG